MGKIRCTSRLTLLLTLGILLSAVSSFKKSAYAVSNSTFLRSQKTTSYSNGYASTETSSPLVNPTLNLNRIGQSEITVASSTDGLCEDTFPHPVGNVYFTYDNVTGRLNFSFQLSRSSQTLLGATARVAMVEAIIGYYKINPPYAPHISPSNYDFHGSIYYYNRLGSSARFNIKRGDRLSFTWFVTGTNPRVIITRRVDCTI